MFGQELRRYSTGYTRKNENLLFIKSKIALDPNKANNRNQNNVEGLEIISTIVWFHQTICKEVAWLQTEVIECDKIPQIEPTVIQLYIKLALRKLHN